MKRRNFFGNLLGITTVAAVTPAALARDTAIKELKKPYESKHLPLNAFEKDLSGVLDYDGNLYIALFTAKQEQMKITNIGSTNAEIMEGAKYDVEASYKGYSRQKVPRDRDHWKIKHTDNLIQTHNKKRIEFPPCKESHMDIDIIAICPGPMAEPILKAHLTQPLGFYYVKDSPIWPVIQPGDLDIEEQKHHL